MESDGTSAEWESAMELCHLGINGIWTREDME